MEQAVEEQTVEGQKPSPMRLQTRLRRVINASATRLQRARAETCGTIRCLPKQLRHSGSWNRKSDSHEQSTSEPRRAML